MEGDVPTYQYACTACGHQLEAVQSFSDDPLTECPVCEGRLRKLFSSVGIVFKGSGFYRTDSRAGNEKVGAGVSGSKEPGDGGPTPDKADKPAKPADGAKSADGAKTAASPSAKPAKSSVPAAAST
jgi:putative FmdB family regulatory protein